MAQQGSSNFGHQRGVDPPWTPPTQTYAGHQLGLLLMQKCIQVTGYEVFMSYFSPILWPICAITCFEHFSPKKYLRTID